MPRFTPDDFPTLRAHARQASRFDEAVMGLAQALDAGVIRKTQLDELKMPLGRALEKAWETEVGAAYFHAGKWESQPAEVYELYADIDATSLFRVPTGLRKIAKAALPGDVPQRMRAILEEAEPLATAIEDLKPMIIKGRAPAAPKPENPNKVTGTCSCCQRDIAVARDGAGMAHHGYQRPGHGEQTSSCFGINFPPLETSTEGLEWLIGVRKDALERWTDFEVSLRDEKRNIVRVDVRTRRGVETREFSPGDEGFDRARRHRLAEVESENRMRRKDLDFLAATLTTWQDFHRAKLCAKNDMPEPEDGPTP